MAYSPGSTSPVTGGTMNTNPFGHPRGGGPSGGGGGPGAGGGSSSPPPHMPSFSHNYAASSNAHSHSHPHSQGHGHSHGPAATTTTTTATTTTAPISKRDKRRSALQERLQDLTASFSQNRDAQFRQQLHALQCDMTLINNADPYALGPLPDSAEDVARLVEGTVGGGLFGREMASLSGMWYAKFVQEVNQVKEEKDAELAMLVHRHESNLNRFKREYAFRNHFAAEEYNNLSSTLRERLVQSITGKKSRLMREKEQLDIADTNSLLLHPNQFSITNPASPGGIHGNRKTRHTRHRVDLDDLGNGIGSEVLNKRKRKATTVADDNDVGSPVRDGVGIPEQRSRSNAVNHHPTSTYSLNSLFTDKELSAHSNHAHIATVHFFSTSKRADQPGGGGGAGGPNNSNNNTDADDASGIGDNTGQEDNGGTPATDMVRTASQNFHATRSTRTHGNNALSALAELSDKQPMRPNLPYHVLANHQPRLNANAPPPPPLMNEEMEDDWARIEQLSHKPRGWIDRTLIDVLVDPGPEQIDGVPQDPDRFSMLHPDFPATMGVHWYPLRPDRERPEMLGGGSTGTGGERKKRG